MTSLEQLLEELESPAPSANGGTAAAVAAAMAASLAAMVARGAEWPGATSATARAGALREHLLQLGRDDVEAFAAVLRAHRSLRASGSGDRTEVAEALFGATEVPLEIARCAAEVTELAGEAARGGRGPKRLDAVVAAMLAEAATRAATAIVEGNLRALPPGHEERAGALLTAARGAAKRAADA